MGLCDSVWVTPAGAPSIAVVVFVGSVQCYSWSSTLVIQPHTQAPCFRVQNKITGHHDQPKSFLIFATS